MVTGALILVSYALQLLDQLIIVLPDMDDNKDDLITIFEYRTYIEDGSMEEQFDAMWIAYVPDGALNWMFIAMVPLAHSSYYRAGHVVSGKPLSPFVALARSPPADHEEDEVEKVVKMESNYRKKKARDMGVDVAFVVDCTSSMTEWIEQVKDKLTSLHNVVHGDNPHVCMRVAFVGYRDFNDGDERFVTHNLTSSLSSIKRFLAKVEAKASPNSDTPEDVLGGLKSALRLRWKANVRFVILLGDAPCHGSEYYEATDHDGNPIPPARFDYYPNGDPEVRLPQRAFFFFLSPHSRALTEQLSEELIGAACGSAHSLADV